MFNLDGLKFGNQKKHFTFNQFGNEPEPLDYVTHSTDINYYGTWLKPLKLTRVSTVTLSPFVDQFEKDTEDSSHVHIHNLKYQPSYYHR